MTYVIGYIIYEKTHSRSTTSLEPLERERIDLPHGVWSSALSDGDPVEFEFGNDYMVKSVTIDLRDDDYSLSPK